MDAFKSLVQPLVGGGAGAGSGIMDGMKLVVLGGTVETARRVSSSAWSHFVNSFFLTAHFSEEDYPYDWLMFWLARRPEWQRSREFEATTRTTTPGSSSRLSSTLRDSDGQDFSFGDEDLDGAIALDDEMTPGKEQTRVMFQPTFDTTHTIYWRGHLLRVKRTRKAEPDCTEMLSVSVVARSNTILKQLVLQAKKEYEAESVHRIQIYFADSHGSWRWSDSRHKRPMSSIVLNPGVKEMLLGDTRDFLCSEKWYADRGIPFRRGYLLHGVPGSGKSSLIHALAGELMLDIYVVSLSSSWMNDSVLQTLMGRVPARCVVLLEDLDAAFTRSTTRDLMENGDGKDGKDGKEKEGDKDGNGKKKKSKDQLSDVNTLSLSGLLNALDGVAAAEGRLLFATTNHLERLDPALSRPGRMDVWIEFKNASRWQAEALFRNFFPSIEDLDRRDAEILASRKKQDNDDDDDITLNQGELDSIHLPGSPPPQSMSSASELSSTDSKRNSSSWWTGSAAGSTASLLSSPSSSALSSAVNVHSKSPSDASSVPKPGVESRPPMSPTDFGARNEAYLPPPPAEKDELRHSAKPLDAKTLGRLAAQFADSIPEDEFSVAALQGYLLRNKIQPAGAASNAAEWVRSEREMRERLKREREERELKERMERDIRRREMIERERERRDLEVKEAELLKMRQHLHDSSNAAAAAQAAGLPLPVPSVSAPPPPSSAFLEQETAKVAQAKKALEEKEKKEQEEKEAQKKKEESASSSSQEEGSEDSDEDDSNLTRYRKKNIGRGPVI